MKKTPFMQLTLLAALVALALAGCAKKPATETVDSAVTAPGGGAQPGAGEQEGAVREARISEEPVIAGGGATPAAPAAQSTPELQRIFFDYDQYTLTPEARQILADNAAYMKQRPQGKFVVEGHSDERGSDEYNLALGERRAQAARDYLLSLGIPGDRLAIVSYGEERPLQTGSGEEAWAQNRRAEFLLR